MQCYCKTQSTPKKIQYYRNCVLTYRDGTQRTTRKTHPRGAALRLFYFLWREPVIPASLSLIASICSLSISRPLAWKVKLAIRTGTFCTGPTTFQSVPTTMWSHGVWSELMHVFCYHSFLLWQAFNTHCSKKKQLKSHERCPKMSSIKIRFRGDAYALVFFLHVFFNLN